MSKKIFVTGISTDVGKTLVAAVLVEALKADYWKPVQAGELEFSDTDKVKDLITNKKSKFFPNAYALKTPMSPHAAAEIDGVEIQLENISIPKTENTLIIEGAGGLLVPLNNTQTILDIIPKEALVVVVSRHYLGSINHTLMTLSLLKQQKHKVVVVYSGDKHVPTEEIIAKMSGVQVVLNVPQLSEIDSFTIKKLSEKIKIDDFVSLLS